MERIKQRDDCELKSFHFGNRYAFRQFTQQCWKSTVVDFSVVTRINMHIEV